jgi:hypothetical protein
MFRLPERQDGPAFVPGIAGQDGIVSRLDRERPSIVRTISRISPLTGLPESYVGTVQPTSLYGLHPPERAMCSDAGEPLLLATLEPGEDRVRNVRLASCRSVGGPRTCSRVTCSACLASRLRMCLSLHRLGPLRFEDEPDHGRDRDGEQQHGA